MRIGDAAAAAGTTPRALRFYEENGLLPPPPRTAAGQRVYGPRDVRRLRVIRQLLELGLTVADVRLAADRLDLLDSDQLPRQGKPAPGPRGSCSTGSRHWTPRSSGSPSCATSSRPASSPPSARSWPPDAADLVQMPRTDQPAARDKACSASRARALTTSAAGGRSVIRSAASPAQTGSGGTSPPATASR